MTANCPKCDAECDIQEAEPDVGVERGCYCDDCDYAFDPDDGYEYHETDVGIMPVSMLRDVEKPIGTPISEISTQPGTPGYDEWLRISKSWGHD